jgi:DNA-binding CsgD family transcriptional regulator
MLPTPFFDEATIGKLIRYPLEVEGLDTTERVLGLLHDIIATTGPLHILGANRFAVKVGDWRRLEIGKTIFIHSSVPRGWVNEWRAFVTNGYPIGLLTARMCIAPFTWTELSRRLEPVGIDRWPFELALKYGMRDGFICPVGGRWVVAFWTAKPLQASFDHQARGLLYMAASAAAVRLEKLCGEDVKRVGSRSHLTQRELSVLRQASIGASMSEIAKGFNLGEETVRSHFKKAQARLGTRNRTHTVAEAMRQLLLV